MSDKESLTIQDQIDETLTMIAEARSGCPAHPLTHLQYHLGDHLGANLARHIRPEDREAVGRALVLVATVVERMASRGIPNDLSGQVVAIMGEYLVTGAMNTNAIPVQVRRGDS